MLEDWRTAPIDDRLRSMLGFIETLTLEPDRVGPHDVAPLREAGLSDEAIEDAIHVCALFNIIDRVADTFDFDVPGPEALADGATALLRRGYR